MIIELCGLPGSGKTTCARKLVAEAGYTLITVGSRRELVWLNMLFFLKYPLRFFITAWYIARYGGSPRLFYYKFTNAFLHHNAKYMKARRYPRALIDQGHMQNAFIVFEMPVSQDTMKRYLAHMPKADRLIVFDITLPEAKKRMRERGSLPRAWMSEEYFEAWSAIAEHNYKTFRSIVSKEVDTCRIIDARVSREEVFQEISACIQ